MKAPSPAQPSIPPPQPPIASISLPADNVAHSITAENLDPEKVRVHTTGFTPQMRAIFAESGRSESLLND